MVFNIQRFSTHDGNGIRTIIFYKGCPLRCQWCSNPESHSFGPSIMYDQRNCSNFGDCIKVEPRAITRSDLNGIHIDRTLLRNPINLKDVCVSKAITISGEDKSIAELMQDIEKDFPFYRKDGGVTLSGGEPLSQKDDLFVLLEELRNKSINVNVETSLYVDWDRIERCMGLVDTFLVDLKHVDRMKFRTYVGGDANLVLRHLSKLAGSEADVIVRIPVIPGFNHTVDEMAKMIDFVSTLGSVPEIHFLPYHTMGLEKYKMLGKEYLFGYRDSLPESEIEPYQDMAHSRGLQTKIGG